MVDAAGGHRGRARRRRALPPPQKGANPYTNTNREPALWLAHVRPLARREFETQPAHGRFNFISLADRWSPPVSGSAPTRAHSQRQRGSDPTGQRLCVAQPSVKNASVNFSEK